MNKTALTIEIESKGYTLKEFLEHIGFSLRWFRIHSKRDSARYDFLIGKIEGLEQKNDE